MSMPLISAPFEDIPMHIMQTKIIGMTKIPDGQCSLANIFFFMWFVSRCQRAVIIRKL